MPAALSTSERGTKPSKSAQPSAAFAGAGPAASADVQRMPAYADAHAPSVSLLGGAIQRKPADERREEEEPTAGVETPVQKQAAEDKEIEPAEQPTSQDEDLTDVQTKSAASGGGAASSSTSGGASSSVSSSSSNGNGASSSTSSGASSSNGDNGSRVQAAASRGLSGATQELPEGERIQESFGRYDVSNVRVQVGGPAERANENLGAAAYTSGNRIAFKEQPDLRLAAHEAAHVVQQRRGVQLKGGVGQEGDPYERQADRAADAVVSGESAEGVLADEPRREKKAGGVQMKCDCGGGGCASCSAEEKKEQEPAQEAVQMQLEVTTERKGADELAQAGGEAGAGGGGGAAATEKAAAEEEQASEEEAAAEESEKAAEETKGAAEETSTEQAEVVEQSPAAEKEEEAKKKATEPETTEEREETEPEKKEEEEEREEEEETRPEDEAETQPVQMSTTDEAVEPSTATGDMPIQRKRCDPPPPPPDKKPKEGEAPPPDPPPGKVDEKMKSDGPTAEEESKGCGAEEMDKSLESAAPEEQAASAGEEVAASEPMTSEPEAGGAAGPGGAAPEAASAAGGGGGGGEGGADPAQAAGEEMNASIAQAEEGRGEAVAAYESSTSALEEAAGGASRLAETNVSFPKAEDASEADEKRRSQATDAVRSFLSGGSERVSEAVSFARDVVPERAGAAAESAKSAVEGAAASSASALTARIAQARSDAAAQEAAARSQINAGHDAAVSAIESATTSALETLDKDFIKASGDVPLIEADQMTKLAEAYAEGDREYKAVGTRIGQAATERGEYYANHYYGCHIWKKDSFWDGYLTDRRAKARMKAARDVAKGYKDSLEEEAKKQAKEGMKGLDCDQQAVRRSSAAALATLDSSYQSAVEMLVSAEQKAIASAGSTRDELLKSAARALSSTLKALDDQERTQLKTIEDTKYLQIVAVEHAAHMAAAAMQGNILEAAQALMGAVGAVASALTNSFVPEPKVLSGALAQGTAKMDAGLGGLYEKIEGGLTTVEGQIAAHGTQSSEAVTSIGTDGIAQADQAMGEFTGGMMSLEQSAADTFGKLSENHTTLAKQTTTTTTDGFKHEVETLKTTYETLNGSVKGRFQEATAGLEAGLRGSLKDMDDRAKGIPKYADEAASKEAPAWKSVVKWVLIIAIIVVVALVVGPAVIGAVGAWAGSAAAGAIIGGAIVGAATGAAIQMLNNWETNSPLLEGVGKAALMGAIGGAIGGAGGLLIGRGVDALGKVAISALSKKAIEVGANLAFDAVQEIGTQLITTGTVDWGGFAESMVMSVATAGMGEIPKVKKIQGGFSARGEKIGAKLPGAPKVSAPDVKAGGTTPSKSESAAPEPAPPKPAAPEPEAAAPKVAPEPEAVAPPKAPEAEPAAPRAAETEPGPAPRPAEEGTTPAETAPTKPAAEVEAETKAVADAAEGKPRPGPGDAPRLEAAPDVPAKQRTNEELNEAAASTKVGDEQHGVVPRDWMGEVKLFACSPSCAPITDKIQNMLKSEGITPDARARLEALDAQIKVLEAKIKNGEVSSADIVKETGRVAEQLQAIGKLSPELGAALNVPVGGKADAEIRAEEAPMWAVDPETGKFDPKGKMDGLDPADVDALARQPAKPGESHAVYRRRRYLADKAAETPPGTPLGMKEWCESGFRANVNRDVSGPMETAALGATGATPNNAAGQRKEHTTTEHVDKRGRPVPEGDPTAVKKRTETTRPDGTRPNKRGGEDVIEHKHLTGNEDTLDDSHQLRAQRDMAVKLNGDHELVISSDRPLKDGTPDVQPSKPLGESDSRIYYYDPVSGRVTHQWVKPGKWRKISPASEPLPATKTGAK